MEQSFAQIVRARIQELERLDDKRQVFGAGSHRYRLGPVIPSAALAQIEAQLGIELPQDYRAFLTEVGNGGAGPSYGVMAFQGRDSEDYTKYDRLNVNWRYEHLFNPIGIIYGDDEQETEEQANERSEKRRTDYWKTFDSSGGLYICHHGCGSRSMLVVSGPCRGEVWFDAVAEDAGYGPETSNGVRLDFRTWYLRWLDSSVKSLSG